MDKRFSIFLLIVFICFGSSVVQAQTIMEKTDSLEMARQELKTRLSTLIDQKKQLLCALSATQSELDKINPQIKQVLVQIPNLTIKAQNRKDEMALVKSRIDYLDPQIRIMEQAFHKRLKTMYIHGPDTGLTIMATSKDFHDALTRSQNLNHLVKKAKDQLQNLRQQQKKLFGLKNRLSYKRKELLNIIKDKKQLTLALNRMRRNKLTLLEELEARKKQLAQNIDTLIKAQAGLARTLAMVKAFPFSQKAHNASFKKHQTVISAKGNLSPPVEGSIAGTHGLKRHGVYIKAKLRAPVRAPWWGKVAFAGPLAGYGKVTVLDHGQRVHTVLANLGALSVSKGQEIKAGSVVGYVGPTKRIYLEVRKGAKPVNPLKWLRLSP